jgi:hypothetical protein
MVSKSSARQFLLPHPGLSQVARPQDRAQDGPQHGAAGLLVRYFP